MIAKKILYFVFVCILLTSCGPRFVHISPEVDIPQGSTFNTAHEINVPQGYTFLGASEWGLYSNSLTLYYREDESGKFFKCEDGACEELVFPEGYTFIDASAWGSYAEKVTYYCKQETTGRIFTCHPE